MRQRCLTSLGALVVGVFVVVSLAPVLATAQTEGWTVPRTPDGHPDLQGVWANNSATPLERPEGFEEKPLLSEEELATVRERAAQLASSSDAGFVDEVFRAATSGAEEFESSCEGTGNYNNFWLSEREFDNRTSLIVDPPDGRIPYLADMRQVMEEQRRRYLDPEPPASWEELGLLTRCITNGVPNLLPGYNANYQILQAPGYVVILQELFHEARVIPLDGREHIDSGIRQLLGDSRGSWEGDALVIHTRNFSNTTSLRGAGENLHLVERYTRVGPDTVAYEFTVEDPTTFASNWTTRILLKRSEGPIFEYACHEGNRGLPNILSGARAQDRAAAEAGQSGSR